LVEFVWDQTSDTGAPVDPGDYDIYTQVDNLYLDDREISDFPMGVDLGLKRVHVMQ
jgi:hypothetical protein